MDSQISRMNLAPLSIRRSVTHSNNQVIYPIERGLYRISKDTVVSCTCIDLWCMYTTMLINQRADTTVWISVSLLLLHLDYFLKLKKQRENLQMHHDNYTSSSDLPLFLYPDTTTTTVEKTTEATATSCCCSCLNLPPWVSHRILPPLIHSRPFFVHRPRITPSPPFPCSPPPLSLHYHPCSPPPLSTPPPPVLRPFLSFITIIHMSCAASYFPVILVPSLVVRGRN